MSIPKQPTVPPIPECKSNKQRIAIAKQEVRNDFQKGDCGICPYAYDDYDGGGDPISLCVFECKWSECPLEIKASNEIDYRDCSNALLKMWIDNVITDSEYYKIADRLNTVWKEKNYDGKRKYPEGNREDGR